MWDEMNICFSTDAIAEGAIPSVTGLARTEHSEELLHHGRHLCCGLVAHAVVRLYEVLPVLFEAYFLGF
jgi:hypothetical protein